MHFASSSVLHLRRGDTGASLGACRLGGEEGEAESSNTGGLWGTSPQAESTGPMIHDHRWPGLCPESMGVAVREGRD